MELLHFAKRVAFRASKDPEAESVMHEAVLKAVRAFDPAKQVPLKKWVALVVERDVWCYGRKQKRRAECVEPEILADTLIAPEWVPEPDIHPADWQIVYERYVKKLPIDVIARVRLITVYEAQKLLKAAEARCKEAMRNEDH